jgi:hypothetical protein
MADRGQADYQSCSDPQGPLRVWKRIARVKLKMSTFHLKLTSSERSYVLSARADADRNSAQIGATLFDF